MRVAGPFGLVRLVAAQEIKHFAPFGNRGLDRPRGQNGSQAEPGQGRLEAALVVAQPVAVAEAVQRGLRFAVKPQAKKPQPVLAQKPPGGIPVKRLNTLPGEYPRQPALVPAAGVQLKETGQLAVKRGFVGHRADFDCIHFCQRPVVIADIGAGLFAEAAQKRIPVRRQRQKWAGFTQRVQHRQTALRRRELPAQKASDSELLEIGDLPAAGVFQVLIQALSDQVFPSGRGENV